MIYNYFNEMISNNNKFSHKHPWFFNIIFLLGGFILGLLPSIYFWQHPIESWQSDQILFEGNPDCIDYRNVTLNLNGESFLNLVFGGENGSLVFVKDIPPVELNSYSSTSSTIINTIDENTKVKLNTQDGNIKFDGVQNISSNPENEVNINPGKNTIVRAQNGNLYEILFNNIKLIPCSTGKPGFATMYYFHIKKR